MTENPKTVDDLQREVNIVISPMEDLSFDPFRVENAHDWAVVVEEFREDVVVGTIYCDCPKNSKNRLDCSY